MHPGAGGIEATRRVAAGPARARPVLEVLRLIGTGHNNAELAALLGIAESTAKTHARRTLAKIDTRDRVQAVVIAYQNGLMRIR